MNYLIPEFTGMGDVIQQTPMIRAIHDVDKNAQIFVLREKAYRFWKKLREFDVSQ